MKSLNSLLVLFIITCLASCDSSPSFSYEDIDYSTYQFYDLTMGDHPVGFHSELHWDQSRTFNDMDQRPLLIGLWYPAVLSDQSKLIQYKDYLLANVEHDGIAINDTTMSRLKAEFTEGLYDFFGVTEANAIELLELPVRAFKEAEVMPGKHPMLLYAASFNAGIHENSPLFEMLASHGYVVASIASVGHQQPGMSADSLGIAAQLADFEMLYDKVTQRSYVDTDKIATSGFSWGGFSATLMGIDKEAQLMVSMDGSQTYFPQAVAQYQETYDRPAKGAYLQLGQRMAPNAQFTQDTMVYHWIGQNADAYLYRFKMMDHRDFGGSFQYFNAVADDSVFRAQQAQNHSEIYSKAEKGAVYLRTAEMIHQALDAYLLGDANRKSALSAQPDSHFSIKRRHASQ